MPGEQAGTHGLRIGIRDNYLNLYVKGQAVAYLQMNGAVPSLALHTKYYEGAAKGTDRARKSGQSSTRLPAADLATADVGAVERWIRTAETFAGDEKRFVDDLLSVTPGVLDLEMSLPGYLNTTRNKHTSPRMDIVVAQGSSVAFWEAKCAVNDELRSGPPMKGVRSTSGYRERFVLTQLWKYVE